MIKDFYSLVKHQILTFCRISQEERSVLWEVIVLVILSKKVCMYKCLIPNGFRGRAISLYSYKFVDKK
jgi:hypothetical protein